MITDSLKKDLQQVRLNGLCAKHIHRKLLAVPWWGKLFVDITTFLVPIIFFAPKMIWNQPEYQKMLSTSDILITVALLVLSATSKTLDWEGLLTSHRSLISKNIRMSNQALELLIDDNATDEAAKWFLRLAKEPDLEEQTLFEGVKDKMKQKAYRESLKEYSPSNADATCQVCGMSVWKYEPGNCSACGGKKH